MKQNVQMHTDKLPYILILCVLLLTTIAVISLMACVPPVSRDALTHHLVIPKLYLEHGGIYEIPRFWFSYFPMNVTFLYAIPLYFGNDILPKYIHFAFAIATAALIYRYLKRRLDSVHALLGALFFLTIPVIVKLSTTAYVDLGLIFFLFASLLFLFDWVESDFQIKYLLISAVFCGLALGTKYNGLVGLFLLGLFVPFVYSKYKAGAKFYTVKAVGYCFVFVVVSMIVFSPWMIRNITWTGNPVYPLYKSVFNAKSAQAETIGEEEQKASPGMNHLQIRKYVYGESTLEIALIPIRVFFQGQDDNPKYFDGRMNPFLLLLSIFAFFGIKSGSRQEKTEKWMMLFFSLLFLLIACAQTGIRIRYFSPIIAPLAVLSIFGLYNIQKKLNIIDLSAKIKKISIFSIIFVMLGLNGIYMVSLFADINPMAYLTGEVSRDQYIQHFRPEYASMQHANKNLTDQNRILGVYIGHRGYYSDIDIDFSITKLQDFAAAAETPRDISKKLHNEEFTHLLMNYELFNQFAENYSIHEKKMLAGFFNDYTDVEFSKDGHGLMRILLQSR